MLQRVRGFAPPCPTAYTHAVPGGQLPETRLGRSLTTGTGHRMQHPIYSKENHEQTDRDRQIYRGTDRYVHMDRDRPRQTYTEMDRDRQRERKSDRHRQTERSRKRQKETDTDG